MIAIKDYKTSKERMVKQQSFILFFVHQFIFMDALISLNWLQLNIKNTI